MPTNLFKKLPPTFRNPFELDAEYIHIPAGSFRYSVTKKVEKVPDIYFAKYPVTNKRYRHFIRYLEEQERELLEMLPKGEFDRRMIEFASGIEDFGKYIGRRPNSWAKKLRSNYDTKEHFNGKDQPVVGVSWYAARAYCFWLSLLEAASENLSYVWAIGLYRLPNEIEWEWAASGGKRKRKRVYPWGNIKPDHDLANYEEMVGATTPVGRYPAGATPDGLMDMAGNVCEWMENWHDEDEDARSLRGGSWGFLDDFLRCTECLSTDPGNRGSDFGFRVVRSQS